MKKISLLVLLSGIILSSCSQEDFSAELKDGNTARSASVMIEANTDVSPEQAQKVASLFCVKENKTRGTITQECEEVKAITDKNGAPLMYIINYANNGGFVIVSATKNYQPILAYSDEGSFELPDPGSGLNVWLNENKDIIKYQKGETPLGLDEFRQMWAPYQETPTTLGTSPNPSPILQLTHEKEEEWRKAGYECYRLMDSQSIMSADAYNTLCNLAEANASLAYDYMKYSYVLVKYDNADTEISPLIETYWHQNIPFNGALDPVKGQKPLAGCVAIAMAQIMKYHQWPTKYNWSAMDNSYASTETQQLIKEIGVTAHTSYDIDESTASIGDACNAFKDKSFDYSAKIIDHDYNSDLVTKELKLKRPVCMTGYRDKVIGIIPSGGHAWVCDGLRETKIYKEYYLQVVARTSILQYKQVGITSLTEGYTVATYHMNWGWGKKEQDGKPNGWFGHTSIYIPEENKDYKYNRKDIINIQPNR